MKDRDYDELLVYVRDQFLRTYEALKAGKPDSAMAYVRGSLLQLNDGVTPEGHVVVPFVEITLTPRSDDAPDPGSLPGGSR